MSRDRFNPDGTQDLTVYERDHERDVDRAYEAIDFEELRRNFQKAREELKKEEEK